MAPSRSRYDVIIVGARIAGASTAMLLARAGLEVLVVDRAAEGADTTSTHALLAPAVALLDDWNVLGAVGDAGTPPVTSATFWYENRQPVTFDLADRPLFAPRRTVIDPILADAARAAGAEVRFGTRLVDLLYDEAGGVAGAVLDASAGPRAVAAPLVIGADGIHSIVARRVGAEITYRSSHASGVVMACFAGLAHDGYHWYHARRSSAGRIPTNHDQTHVFAAVSSDRFRAEMRANVAAGFAAVLAECAPELADLTSSAVRATKFRSFPGLAGFTRKPFGPGWALVGDAGAFTDPMSAHGMSAALRDASFCAEAAAAYLRSPHRAQDAWHWYERARDAVTIPFIDAVDIVTAYRHDVAEIQRAHVAMSRLTHDELRMIRGHREAPAA